MIFNNFDELKMQRIEEIEYNLEEEKKKQLSQLLYYTKIFCLCFIGVPLLYTFLCFIGHELLLFDGLLFDGTYKMSFLNSFLRGGFILLPIYGAASIIASIIAIIILLTIISIPIIFMIYLGFIFYKFISQLIYTIKIYLKPTQASNEIEMVDEGSSK